MFLKQKNFLVIMLIGFCFTAQAQPPTSLAAGTYRLDSGVARLCPNFSVTESETFSKSITVGSLYSFEAENSNHNLESDLDSNCEFREQNRRVRDGDETKLTRINEEWCKGKIVSTTVSAAVINHDTIEVRHEIKSAEPYTCVWRKLK
jgi:hypothetical protein